jgi:hypothetical protein
MRHALLILLLWLLSACQEGDPQITISRTIESTSTSTADPSELAIELPTTTAEPKSSPNAPWPFSTHLHPDGGLYVGDLVSFEIISETLQRDKEVMVSIEGQEVVEFEWKPFVPQGFNSRSTATFRWVWDTNSFDPGEYILVIEVSDGGPTWREEVLLQPIQALPTQYGQADWEISTSQCCQIYFISGTASQRDLEIIAANIDTQAEYATDIMGMEFIEAPEVVMIPRVIGHGGFTSDEVYISYLDRNYTSNSYSQVLRHEMVHLLDRQSNNKPHPAMLAEGYAVFLSGGHYWEQALLPQAAALLPLEWYVPLPDLAAEFYLYQHEIGYLEAGALIEFMVDRWGWEPFQDFYRDVEVVGANDQMEGIDRALYTHFGIDLEELDTLFTSSLSKIDIDQKTLADVEVVVAFYDTVRRYQENFDPTAYFRSAWFLDIDEMGDKDITADYLRRPTEIENIVLEIMLADTGKKMGAGDTNNAQNLISTINDILTKLEENHPDAFKTSRVGTRYLELVSFLVERGYTPHSIALENDLAHAMVSSDGPDLIEIWLAYSDSTWQVVEP